MSDEGGDDRPRVIKKKIVLLGDNAVGKTSLIKRFVLDHFDDKYIATIGTKVSKKVIDLDLRDGKVQVMFMIWDVLGQHQFNFVLSTALKGSEGALLVCDVTRKDTLENLEKHWIKELKDQFVEIPMVFIANKADLTGQAKFEQVELAEMAAKYHDECLMTSAKTGKGVEEAFKGLGERILAQKEDEDLKDLDDIFASLEMMQLESRELDGHVTLAKVLDATITDFCEQANDVDHSMEKIREAAVAVDLDINHPTKERVQRFIELLAEIERKYLLTTLVKANLAKRLNWMGMAE